MKKNIFWSILLLVVVFVQNPVFLNAQATDIYQIEQTMLKNNQRVLKPGQKGHKWYRRALFENISRSQQGETNDLQQNFVQRKTMQMGKNQLELLNNQAAWSPLPSLETAQNNDPNAEVGVGRINHVEFHPTDKNIMFAAAPHGGIWKTINAGQSWYPVGDKLDNMRISTIIIDPNNTNIVYAATGDYAYISVDVLNAGRYNCFGNGVIKSTDAGETWANTGLTTDNLDFEMSIIGFLEIQPVTGEILAAGAQGVWKSSDAGATWRHINNTFIWDVQQHPSNPDVLIASSGTIQHLGVKSVKIMKSVDFGETWKDAATELPNNGNITRTKLAISPTNPNKMYALSCSAYWSFYNFSVSTDAGETWVVKAAGGNTQNILGWDILGDDYEYGGQGDYDLALLVDSEDENKVYVGGVNIWMSSNMGEDWDIVSCYDNACVIHCDIHELLYNPHTNDIFACTDGGIFKSSEINHGTIINKGHSTFLKSNSNWTHVNNNLANNEYYRMGFSKYNPDYIAGGCQDNSFYYYYDSKITNIFGADGFETLIHPNNPNKIYGAIYNGYTYYSDDYGNTSHSGGELNQIVMWGEDMGGWCVPFLMDNNNPDILYLALGQVYKYDVSSAMAEQISDFPISYTIGYPVDAYAMEMCRTNTDYIYVSKRMYPEYNIKGSVSMTSNGGATWKTITGDLPVDKCFISYITVDDDDPLHVWVSCSHFYEGNKVFESTNGGSTWKNISYNLPNVPVNCVRHQPESERDIVYLATDMGVYYKKDTDTKWTLYTNNLPNVICTEIEIDVISKRVYVATFGRGIWVNDMVNDDDSGIEEQLYQSSMNIYPNPNNGEFTLKIDGIDDSMVDIEIVDVLGRVMYSSSHLVHGEIAINVKQYLLSGLYYLRVFNDKGYSRTLQLRVE